MFPGLTTRLSEENIALASVISPKSDLAVVTSTTVTTVVVTINPPFAGFGGILVLVNRSGGTITGTAAGNIAATISVINNKAIALVYSSAAGVWVPLANAA